MPAGYSQRPLPEKLGIKAGSKILFLNAPKNYSVTLGELPATVKVCKHLCASLDFIQFFCRSQQELEHQFSTLKSSLAPNGSLWISWPKGASKLKTDLSENVVRNVGLKHALVDVKVCAVDETWSGLKFVFRLKDRK